MKKKQRTPESVAIALLAREYAVAYDLFALWRNARDGLYEEAMTAQLLYLVGRDELSELLLSATAEDLAMREEMRWTAFVGSPL